MIIPTGSPSSGHTVKLLDTCSQAWQLRSRENTDSNPSIVCQSYTSHLGHITCRGGICWYRSLRNLSNSEQRPALPMKPSRASMYVLELLSNQNAVFVPDCTSGHKQHLLKKRHSSKPDFGKGTRTTVTDIIPLGSRRSCQSLVYLYVLDNG